MLRLRHCYSLHRGLLEIIQHGMSVQTFHELCFLKLNKFQQVNVLFFSHQLTVLSYDDF
jgi:hypothetical protein